MWILFVAFSFAVPGDLGSAAPTTPTTPSTPIAPAATAVAAPEAKQAEVRRLLVLTGADRLAVQSLDTMISGFRAAMPEVPAEVWAELRTELRTEDLLDKMAALYTRRFTAEEIAALVAFYESPLGRRLVEEQPAIYAEATRVGQEWGVEAAERAIETLRARGVVF